MDTNQKRELVAQAIQKLLEDKRNRDFASDGFTEEDGDHQLLLSKLLSQLETIESEEGWKNKEREISREEIRKHVIEIKKQNTVTHWLLSVMIVLTLTWQLSEFSLLLQLKKGLSHPLRSIGSMFLGMVKRSRTNVVDAEKQLLSSSKEELKNNLSNIQPSIKIAELPRLDLPDFGLSDEE